MTNRLLGVDSYELWPRVHRDGDLATAGYLRIFHDALDRYTANLLERSTDVVERDGSIETAEGQALLAWGFEQGVAIPSATATRIRTFLASAPSYQKAKGDPATIKAAIFALTGLVVTVRAPFQTEALWSFGVSVFGYATMADGPTRATSPDRFRMGGDGAAVFGLARFGDDAINPEIPFNLYVELPYEPTADILALVVAVVDGFRRAIDRPIYTWPEGFTIWTIGKTSATVVTEAERVVMPDGTLVADFGGGFSFTDFDLDISFTLNPGAGLALGFGALPGGRIEVTVSITGGGGTFTTSDDPTPRTSGTFVVETGVDVRCGGTLTAVVSVPPSSGVTFSTSDDPTPVTSGTYPITVEPGGAPAFEIIFDVSASVGTFAIDFDVTPTASNPARATTTANGSRIGIDATVGSGYWIFGVHRFGYRMVGPIAGAGTVERIELPDGTLVVDV